MKRKIYRGAGLNEISFPLGGIGTGSLGLAGNGRLIDWEIFNNASKNSPNGFSHFAIKAERDGKVLDARVLQGDYTKFYTGQISHTFGHGIANTTMAGFPHFRHCAFCGEYPIARISLDEPSFPGAVRLTAFNPFIPLNADDSGIPAAFFSYRVKNTTDADIDYIIAGTLKNPREKGFNKPVHGERFTGVTLGSEKNVRDDPMYRKLTLATDEVENVSVQEYWFRGMWYDNIETYWSDFTSPGMPAPRRYDTAGDNEHATVYVRKTAKPGETVEFRFVISWSCPYRVNFWNPKKYTDENGEERDMVMMNYYSYRFPGSEDSARYALAEWDRLFKATKKFHDVLFSSTLPGEVIESVSATASVLKTATVLRIGEKGDFYGWEGLCEQNGSCEGTCSHVWNYVYTTCFLFPELERNIRENDYKYNQAPSGEVMFRTSIPFGTPPATNRACVDGQMGGVLKTYREWKICGNDEWLKAIWPSVKRSVEFAWSKENKDEWDLNRDGVLEGRQHHTLDTEMFGTSSWLQGFYMAALRAGSEMARYLGDDASADEYDRLFERGTRFMNEELFNGEYYYQKIDLTDKAMLEHYCKGNPSIFGGDAMDEYWNSESGEINYQIGEGCEIDQVLAQWHCDIIGLGDIYDPEKLDKALMIIYRYNFKESMRDEYNPYRVFCVNDESGVVMCSFPRTRPAIPILTSCETMHGFEYSFAGLLMSRGHIGEGLRVVRGVRDRYDGAKRNPWNEIECGSNYARSMSSFAFLPILSGMKFDMVRGHLGFAPKVNADNFRCLWSLDCAWGSVEIKGGCAALNIVSGALTLTKLEVAGIRDGAAVTVDGKAVSAAVRDGAVVFDSPVTVRKKLRIGER